MSEKCLICKFHGKNTPSVSTSTIYQASQNQYIHLCYSHSVEFFKMGQVKFVVKYQHDFREHGLSSKDLLRNQSAEGLLTTFR